MSKPVLRRLIDLPGIDDLEYKSVLKPVYMDPFSRAEFPEIDEVSMAVFGITADEAEAVKRPAGWDGIETKPLGAQVFAFEDAGWDVTDNKRKPLRMLAQFNQQLWLAIRGVAGSVPFAAERDKPDDWASNLAAEASRFKKR